MFCNVSGECIFSSSRCDDYADCLDGTDEVGCGTPGDSQIGSGGGDGNYFIFLAFQIDILMLNTELLYNLT